MCGHIVDHHHKIKSVVVGAPILLECACANHNPLRHHQFQVSEHVLATIT